MTAALTAIADAETAEEIFERLDVPYAPAVLRVNRLHVLKRFQEYLAADPAPDRAALQRYLTRAHDDFRTSTPQRERVFAVFRQQPDPQGRTFVPLDALEEPAQTDPDHGD